jgi:hypothetical protein
MVIGSLVCPNQVRCHHEHFHDQNARWGKPLGQPRPELGRFRFTALLHMAEARNGKQQHCKPPTRESML